MDMRYGSVVLGMALLGTAGSAAAQVSVERNSADGVRTSFARCRAITAADARLECFDKAAAALDTAIATKEIAIVDRQEVRKAQRSLFGFTIPRIALFGGGDDKEPREEFTEINTTITSVTPIANGRVQLKLAEGDAVWATTEPMAFPPKIGRKVRIRRGALGNYFIAVDGERSVRGMRVR